jgi:hypothetical protein
MWVTRCETVPSVNELYLHDPIRYTWFCTKLHAGILDGKINEQVFKFNMVSHMLIKFSRRMVF